MQAQFATGGNGIYRNNILWFDWGAAPNTIPNSGATITNTISVAGQTLSVTCTLSAISGTGADPDLQIYRPGSYFEDGLDNLYNVGGIGGANTMDIGISTRADSTDATFTYACSATLGGLPFTLDGLVFADAETTSVGEFTRITPPVGTTMRVIDRYREPGCATGYNVNFTGGTYTFSTLPPNSCFGIGASTNPVGVFFIDNASSATIYLKGGGKQAVALGVFVNVADYGDAPASYGIAAHLPQFNWSGGTVGGGNTNIFGAGFSLATSGQPSSALLGVTVDVEPSSQFSANATGDDLNGTNDEDGVNIGALAPLYRGLAGAAYTVPVKCVGTAAIAAWIDFDRNGIFDADERSGTVNCSGGVANLSWTVNGDIAAGLTFLRVRTALLASSIANPTGLAASGEVEDYALTITDPKLNVAKITQGGVGGPFTFSTTNTVTQPAGLTTATIGTAVTDASRSISNISNAVVVTETALPANWILSTISCTHAGGAAVAGATYDIATRQATLPASALSVNSDITCTFTNDMRPRLSVTKTASANPLVVGVSGQTYTITINVANRTTTNPITLVDILPTGITLSGTPTATGAAMTGCPSTGNTLAGCSIASGAAVGNIIITVPVAVGASAPSSVTNTATAAGGGDPSCTGTAPACTGAVTTATLYAASLQITKTDNKAIATSGTTNTYVVTLTNQGPSPADGSVLTDTVGAGLTCPAANPMTCTVIAAGAVCPSPVTVGNLTGTGVTIATLPANGMLQFAYTCNVN